MKKLCNMAIRLPLTMTDIFGTGTKSILNWPNHGQYQIRNLKVSIDTGNWIAVQILTSSGYNQSNVHFSIEFSDSSSVPSEEDLNDSRTIKSCAYTSVLLLHLPFTLLLTSDRDGVIRLWKWWGLVSIITRITSSMYHK